MTTPTALFLDFDNVINTDSRPPFVIEKHVVDMIKTVYERDIPVYVLSLNTEDVIRDTLKQYKIGKYFSDIHAKDSKEDWGKEGNVFKEDLLLKYRRRGVVPLFVDDDIRNVRAAREEGFRVVHVKKRRGITKAERTRILKILGGKKKPKPKPKPKPKSKPKISQGNRKLIKYYRWTRVRTSLTGEKMCKVTKKRKVKTKRVPKVDPKSCIGKTKKGKDGQYYKPKLIQYYR